jgi:predicted nucleotidyltransferase
MQKPALTKRKRLDTAIRRIVSKIVERFDPQFIFLVGSQATGAARPDSDVDLLVVMPVDGSARRKAIEIGVALHDVPVVSDVVVTSPEDFAWRKDVPGTPEHPATHGGRLLYARS